jgi:predicted acylesterase/phospholipase RssA
MKTSMSVPHTLVLGGGASMVSAFVGGVRTLEQLSRVLKEPMPSHYVGSSGGSFLALLLALNYTSFELERACHDLREMVANSTYELDLLFTRFGGIDGKALFGVFLSRCIETKTGEKSLTFEQLNQHTGRTLTVAMLCLTSNAIEYMTHSTHPDTDVALAVTASCAIPLVFTPVTIASHLYVDPAIVEVAALRMLDAETSTLVFTIDAERNKGGGTPQKLTSYIELVMSSIANVHQQTQLEKLRAAEESVRDRVVRFKVPRPETERFPAVMFPKPEYLAALIQSGMATVREHLKM